MDDKLVMDFYIDADELFKFVSVSDKTDKREQEITDGYDFSGADGGMVPVTKMIREIKTKGDTFPDNLRYDYVKILLLGLFEQKNEFVSYTCFNTLRIMGILKEIKK